MLRERLYERFKKSTFWWQIPHTVPLDKRCSALIKIESHDCVQPSLVSDCSISPAKCRSALNRKPKLQRTTSAENINILSHQSMDRSLAKPPDFVQRDPIPPRTPHSVPPAYIPANAATLNGHDGSPQIRAAFPAVWRSQVATSLPPSRKEGYHHHHHHHHHYHCQCHCCSGVKSSRSHTRSANGSSSRRHRSRRPTSRPATPPPGALVDFQVSSLDVQLYDYREKGYYYFLDIKPTRNLRYFASRSAQRWPE